MDAVLSPEAAVNFIASALFVVAVVNGLKKFYGLQGQVLVPVAVVIGGVVQVLVYYFGGDPLFGRIVLGLLYGGAASGVIVLKSAGNEPMEVNVDDEDLPVVP